MILQIFKLVTGFSAQTTFILGFDANNGYSVSTAIQQGRAFEDYGRIDHFEEPLPQYDLPGIDGKLSDALDVAVSTGRAGLGPVAIPRHHHARRP